jgi:hypothetical protein
MDRDPNIVSKDSFTVVSILIIALLLLFSSSLSIKSNTLAAVADDKDRILLTLLNSSFVPLTNVDGNQVTVSVRYQVNDESLEDEKINGIMKIYSSNGSLMHSSSFSDGFAAEKRGGTEDFKTTIRDPTIQNVVANVSFTDLKKTETLSNVISTNLELEQLPSSEPSAGSDSEEQ